MLVTATARNLNISPRKMRVLADVFKKERATDVLIRLEHTPRSAAKPLAKIIASAMANAKHAHNIDATNMVIANIVVNEATALKRFRPVSKGSAHTYKKRRSHVTVVLEG